MRKQIWTVVVGLAAIAALVAVPAAMAAYTSPKLEVTQAGAVTTVKASLNPNDDPTARVAISAPAGTQLTTNQAPGTVLGPVQAIVKALDLAGADLPLTGQLVVAAPGQVPAATQAACIGSTTPLATWVMVLTAAGQTAHGADLPPPAEQPAARAGVHRDLPAASGRPGWHSRTRDLRREGLQRPADDQRRVRGRVARAPGSRRGCRTTRAWGLRTSPERSSRRPRSRRAQ